jgi:putative SOS response-associated peptidase YedK
LHNGVWYHIGLNILSKPQKCTPKPSMQNRQFLFEKPSFVKAAESQHCLTFSAGFKHFRIKVAIKPQKSVAIITTETNPLMSEIYNIKKRIPVILNVAQGVLWLKGSNEPQLAKDILKPCPNDRTKAI